MAKVGSHYVDLDVPTDVLTTMGAVVQFDLSKECCGGDPDAEYQFFLTRAIQCNGSLISPPLVRFERKENVIFMIVSVPLLEDDPLLVSCARTSLRVEYF